MVYASQRPPVFWGGVCAALLGAAFCALQAGPADTGIPCPSTGCRLFHDLTLWGVSLWWFGTAFFAAVVLLCLRRQRTWAFFLTGLALAADCLLLALMLLTAPCLPCLGAAALMGLLFFLLRRDPDDRRQNPARLPVLLFLWAVLFAASVAAAGAESLGRWVLYGAGDADRRVYFSPSCPACREAIAAFAGHAAFLPVAENDADFVAIARMQAAAADGKTITEALAFALEGQGEGLPLARSMLLRLRLWRNRAEVLRLGFDKLPLLTINGMPQSLRVSRPDAPPPAPAPAGGSSAPDGNGSSALPPELAPLDQCREGPVPCPPGQ